MFPRPHPAPTFPFPCTDAVVSAVEAVHPNDRPTCSVLFANRSAARTRMGIAHGALEDAETCVAMDRGYLKGPGRVAEAWAAVRSGATFDATAIAIKDYGSRGRGWLALRDIPAGCSVLVEVALVQAESHEGILTELAARLSRGGEEAARTWDPLVRLGRGAAANMDMAQNVAYLKRLIETNGFQLARKLAGDISFDGSGLYMLAALFNHSCEPCASWGFLPDGRISVRTLREVPAGSEITITYQPVDVISPYTRIKSLSPSFICQCSRCSDPHHVMDGESVGLRCLACTTVMISDNCRDENPSYRCTACGASLSSEDTAARVGEITSKIDDVADLVRAGRFEEASAQCSTLEPRFLAFLGPRHYVWNIYLTLASHIFTVTKDAPALRRISVIFDAFPPTSRAELLAEVVPRIRIAMGFERGDPERTRRVKACLAIHELFVDGGKEAFLDTLYPVSDIESRGVLLRELAG